MASPSLLSLLSLLSLITYSSSSSANPITLSLTPFTKAPHINPWQRLNHLTTASIARAHHLKHPHNTTKTPLSPRSYGGYSISLSFGTPPQTLPFVFDTGSSLVWFPCTHRYVCTSCKFPNINTTNISTFIPKLSSSSKILGCKNHKCGLVFATNVSSRCPSCVSGECKDICPGYLIQYGSGTTAGILLSETLDFFNKKVSNFVVGCSILSSRQPSGIAGFGRGKASLPAQMGLQKFSYCLVSHRFDDTPKSSEVVLVGESDSGDGPIAIAGTVNYTPFAENPLTSNSAFQDYYYVSLRKISVGGEHVGVPNKFLVPGSDGHGGTIVDSGTTFTFMDREVFELVAQAFEKQMAHYSRAAGVEAETGLRPCFQLAGDKSVVFPELVFHFKGGVKMSLPLADYFSFLGDSDVMCMTIVTNNVAGTGIRHGPAIIIGNFQQQDFYLEFDLKNKRLGFRKQVCK